MIDDQLGVVIVSWNVRDLLARCLYSLFAELDRIRIETRVVVVDNASFDESPEMIRAQFPQVELIAREDNLGFAKGNNLGMRHLGLSASSDLRPAACLLLNPDTEVQPGAITTLLDVMRSRPDAAIVTARLSYGSGAFQHSAFHFPGLAVVHRSVSCRDASTNHV
jgi:GT2 family glycosyltransferase